MPTELFSRLKSRSRSGMWTSRSAGLSKFTSTSLPHSQDFCETRPYRVLCRRIWERNGTSTSKLQPSAQLLRLDKKGLTKATLGSLRPETPYKIFCFAEDDWVGSRLRAVGCGMCGSFLVQVVQSTVGAVSPNFAAPTSPNKSSAAKSTAFVSDPCSKSP